jgi:XTP/dITP diphosphohydrolase
MQEKLKAFERLLTIMDELREKCPWDRKQTMESLRHLSIEELYELSDAILDKDLEEVRKELGDLMLHLIFYSKIGSEKGAFDISEVLNGVCDKLVRRHPHIYGDVKADNEEEVKANWEKIKLKEGKGNKSVLEGVPRSLPSMVKAGRIQDKAKGLGFDWEKTEQVWGKVEEEIQEFKTEADAKSEHMEEEFGDVLFSLINYARHVGINPDDALERTNRKFISRFQFMERQTRSEGIELGDLSPK